MGYDRQNHKILRITKGDGTLTLADMEDLLRREKDGRWLGRYVTILDCSEAIEDSEEFPARNHTGYAEDLYKVEQDASCPVCDKCTPPFLCCPTCGTLWEDMDQNVETKLAAMREETDREIRSKADTKTRDGRLAWYWSYIGAVDMAQQLGLITDQRRQELYKEVEDLKVLAEEKG